jgi:hypothetical protein
MLRYKGQVGRGVSREISGKTPEVNAFTLGC